MSCIVVHINMCVDGHMKRVLLHFKHKVLVHNNRRRQILQKWGIFSYSWQNPLLKITI